MRRPCIAATSARVAGSAAGTGDAARPLAGPALLQVGGDADAAAVAVRAAVVARLAALHCVPITPVEAPAPAGLLRGWLSHWAVEADAPRWALCARYGAQDGSSRLRFPCQPLAALPVDALSALCGGAPTHASSSRASIRCATFERACRRAPRRRCGGVCVHGRGRAMIHQGGRRPLVVAQRPFRFLQLRR